MSGLMKSVKKVFKKVTKAVGKIMPIALAAAAIYFTAAGAIAGTGMGGWSATVNSAIKSMGATGILADTLAGAVTQAGYGAIIGGVGGAMTGQGAMKGAQYGALAGTVTGGLTGAITNPISGPMSSTASAPSALKVGPSTGGAVTPAAGGVAPVAGVAPPTSWMNTRVAGGLVSGGLQGVGAFLTGPDEDARAEAAGITAKGRLEEQQQLAGNYVSPEGKGLLTSYQQTNQQSQKPSERFDPSGPNYIWDGSRITRA